MFVGMYDIDSKCNSNRLKSCKFASIELAPLMSNENNLYWKVLTDAIAYSDGELDVNTFTSTWNANKISILFYEK